MVKIYDYSCCCNAVKVGSYRVCRIRPGAQRRGKTARPIALSLRVVVEMHTVQLHYIYSLNLQRHESPETAAAIRTRQMLAGS